MTTCTNCNGTKVEPNADGIHCHVCSPLRSSLGSSASVVADGVSDYFLFSAIGDLAECAAEIIESAFD